MRATLHFVARVAALLSIVAVVANAARAETIDAETATPALPFRQSPVADARLDAMRGGFVAAGLELSLGIERTTLVNGELVAHTRFSIPDLGRIDAMQARAVAQALSQTTLVQIGANQRVDGGALAGLSGLGAVVIQNGLDGQAIRQTTVVDAATNSLGLLMSRHAQDALRDALSQPLVPK